MTTLVQFTRILVKYPALKLLCDYNLCILQRKDAEEGTYDIILIPRPKRYRNRGVILLLFKSEVEQLAVLCKSTATSHFTKNLIGRY